MKYLLTFLTLIILSGCSFKNEVKAPNNLRLSTPTVQTHETRNKTIVLQLIDSISYVYSKDFIYTDKKGVYHTFLHNRWDERLSSQLQNLLLQSLRQAKLFQNTVTPSSSALYDYILEVSIDNFEYNVINDSKVLIAMNFSLIDSDSKKSHTKTFKVEKNTQTKDAYGALQAYNEAFNELTGQMLQWLEKTIPQR